MNHKTALSLIFGVASATLSAATPADFYPSQSLMAQGKWMRIETGETGVYRISYDELREMGFEDPEKVGVFGQGGRQLPDDFTDSSGRPVVPADIEPVSVLHKDGYLIFYGLGTESIVPESNTGSTFPHNYHYARESRNCYVNRGCYLLSDVTSVEMNHADDRATKSSILSYGLDYWLHEKDLEWNPTGTGRIFLGEDIRPAVASSFDFPYSLPYAQTGNRVRFVGVTSSHPDYSPKIGYTIGNSSKTTTVNVTENALTSHTYTSEGFTLEQNDGVISLAPTTTSSSKEYFNLDHLLMTYQKALPSSAVRTQERYMFPQLSAGQAGVFTIGYSESQMVFDISDRKNPRLLTPMSTDGETATYSLTADRTLPAEIIICPAEACNQPEGKAVKVSNSNLHALASEGADLIIITTANMRPYAERIAVLHQEHDGIRTLVADVRDVYDEFSGGTPDPMAYRSLARMVYKQGAVKPKNLLLFGPLLADSRSIYAEHDHDDFIIAWQDPTSNITLNSGAYNSNEWLGNFDDYNGSKSTYLKTFLIGVGVLPCLSENEAELVVDKIERFMLDESFAARANSYVACGGIGDDQMHASFALAVAGHYDRRTGKSTIVHPVMADAYINRKEAAERFTETMSNEPLMACFFGHGNPYAFGNIYETNDVGLLKNKNLSFMIFAGCTLGRSDRGFKGIGEQMIFNTDHGLVGGLIPSRNSSAYANRDLICAVNEAIYCTNPCCPNNVPLIRRSEPQTIGEAIALAKSACTTSAVEGAYQLVCDPALRIPFPTLDVQPDSEKITVKSSDTVTVSGFIRQPDGEQREAFNGEVILRLMAPAYVCETRNIQSKESRKTAVTYGDRTIQMTAARVKDGKFTASLTVPRSILDHAAEADSTLLYLSAFDPETRLSAAGYADIFFDRTSSAASAEPDTQAPVVERFAYNHATNELEVTVSDNVALDMSEGSMSAAFSLTVDRINQPHAANGFRTIDPDTPRYSKNITLGKLSETTHTAELTVRDAAGNITSSQLVFTPGDDLRPLLTADASAVTKAVNLKIESSFSGSHTLLVTDAAGSQAARIALSDSNLEWDATDENGRRLLPGVYSLTAIDASGRHSEPIRLAIL